MLTDRITEDMRTAMKERDSLRVSVLRLALSEIKNARIEKKDDLTDPDVIQVLRRGVKSREEVIEQYREGGREDLAEKETKEAEILRAYLPQLLEGKELEEVVDAAIAEIGAASMKDMGRVMKAVLGAHPGEVDGKQVQELVKTRLGGGS